MKKNELIRSIAFLLLFALLLTGAALVFDRKTACDYTIRVRGFYKEPENSMDLLFFGTSHMYCTISPLHLWEAAGLHSYVLATQQQPLTATYYYMKESLERQSPKLIVLDLLGACSPQNSAGDAVLRDCIDPLPWSKNKLEMIQALVPEGQRSSYYFNFLKYHSRWKELSAQDFNFSYLNSRDMFRGYIYLTPARPSLSQGLDYSLVSSQAVSEENLKLLLDMKTLAESHGAELVFMIAPYEDAAQDAGIYKSLREFAVQHDIGLLDFNELFDQAGFDGKTDFFDRNHLNITGAAKASALMAQWLMENYGLELVPAVNEEQWRQDYEQFCSSFSR